MHQEKLFRTMVRSKIRNASLENDVPLVRNNLLLVEHPHVFTLGKNGRLEHLLLTEQQLDHAGAEFYKVDRGGDITYHGPGQIVGYPIIDLEQFGMGIHDYVWNLEEVLIKCLNHYSIPARRVDGRTGVWVDEVLGGVERKIASVGVRASRHVTMHGWALNVNSDLEFFGKIVPCGLVDVEVTSIEKELGSPADMQEVKLNLLNAFSDVFRCKFVLDNIELKV